MRVFQVFVLAAGVAIVLSRISIYSGPSAENPELDGAGTQGSSAGLTSAEPAASVPAEIRKEASFETARPGQVFALQTPDPSELAAEAERSPHGLPASLRRFALRMSEFMQSALASVEAAVGAFDTLEECAADERRTEAPQTRIICMANAQRLAQAFPDRLADRYSDLADEAPELAKLVL